MPTTPFRIFYGVEFLRNSHAFWSIADPRQVIGYAPQDNSEIRFRELIARPYRGRGPDCVRSEDRRQEELTIAMFRTVDDWLNDKLPLSSALSLTVGY